MKIGLQLAGIVIVSVVHSLAQAKTKCDLSSFGDFSIVPTKYPTVYLTLPNKAFAPLQRNELGWTNNPDDANVRTFAVNSTSATTSASIIELKGQDSEQLEIKRFSITGGTAGTKITVWCKSCPGPKNGATKFADTCILGQANVENTGLTNCLLYAGSPGIAVMVNCTNSVTQNHRLLSINIIKP